MNSFKTSRLAGAALLALALSAAPVLAIDTGGNDGGGSTGGSTGGTTGGSSGGTTHHSSSNGGNAGAMSSGGTTATVTLATGRADIAGKHWTKAIADLKIYVASHPSSADGFNLLGYSYRNAGDYTLAGTAYATALKLDPNHTGALEYQGILFIKQGQTAKAQANLAKIKTICGTTCEAYEDLSKALG
jgi:tetratricopeptide (TPR) repeat protein